jgi:hypothetical protein
VVVLPTCACRQERYWSTDPPPPEKIAQTNELRRQHGVRQIKDDWVFYIRNFGEEVWKDGEGGSKKVCYDDYSGKHGTSRSHEYSYDYDRILWEEDYYYTGRTFPSFDTDAGTTYERLTVHYDYRTRRFTVFLMTDSQEVLAVANSVGFHAGMGATNQETSRAMQAQLMAINKFYGMGGATNEKALELADNVLKIWGKSRL